MLAKAKELHKLHIGDLLPLYRRLRPVLRGILEGRLRCYRHDAFVSHVPALRASLSAQFTTGFLDHDAIEELCDQVRIARRASAFLAPACDPHRLFRVTLTPIFRADQMSDDFSEEIDRRLGHRRANEYLLKVLLPVTLIAMHGVWVLDLAVEEMAKEEARDSAEDMLIKNTHIIQRLHSDALAARFGPALHSL